MYDVAVFFLYHNSCDITKLHYKLLCDSNPTIPVIPLGCDIPYNKSKWFFRMDSPNYNEYLDKIQQHLYYARINPNRWKSDLDMWDWFNCDRRVYCWFDLFEQTCLAERYIIFDWDAHINSDLRESYNHLWDVDLAASWFHTQQTNPKWPWWNGCQTHGAGPLCGMLFSYEFLKWIVTNAADYFAFCELRIGQFANDYGAITKTLDLPNLWAQYCKKPALDSAGIYHPVKQYSNHVTAYNLKDIELLSRM